MKWGKEPNIKALQFGIVVSRFNSKITERLLTGALAVFEKEGVPSSRIEVVEVPGAFEIPGVAAQMAQCGCYHTIVCLGAVIRGDTPHFDYICAEVARGIGQVAILFGLPVIFGVLTTETVKQAMMRSGGKMNKGADAALSAIEMAQLYQGLNKKHGGVAPLA
ncbi:MAG: 6,7-dimethyl-8-ribityllumazine synthase [Nitrospirota bacterium]